MARTFNKGTYIPENPQKYTGSKVPVWRSLWEREFMKMLDNTPNVLEWSSEEVTIPYRNPITGKQTVYIPDFLVTMVSEGRIVTKLIEIKPLKETLQEHASSDADAWAQIKNKAKWGAAMMWCERRSDAEGHPVVFEIQTEATLFSGGSAIEAPKRQPKSVTTIFSVPDKQKKPKTRRARAVLAKTSKPKRTAKASSNMIRKIRLIQSRTRRIKPL